MTDTDPAPREWAFIAYLCGDNAQIAAHVRAQVAAVLGFTGSPHLHVAVQWDLLGEGAERAAIREDGTWERERVGRVNSGAQDTWVSFFRWAFDRCPSERVIVMVGGTGLLDPRAAYGNPQRDRTHLFTICEDETDNDALSLSELGVLLRRLLDSSDRAEIDVLALDMREVQCLEVAYEVDDSAAVLIAPQTRIPDEGWDFAIVLRRCAEALASAPRDAPLDQYGMGRVLVQAIAEGYEARRTGVLSISALDLRALNDVASAFDTLSLAMVHSVGEELVWKARAGVAHRLRGGDGLASSGGASAMPTSGAAGSDRVDQEFLYDLPELLAELEQQCAAISRTGLVDLVVEHLVRLDVTALVHSLRTIDIACFWAGARLRHPSMRATMADPRAARRLLRAAIRDVQAGESWWSQPEERRREALSRVFTDPAAAAATRHSWLDDWPDDAILELESALAGVYRVALRQQQRLLHLAALTRRVRGVLRGDAVGPLTSSHRHLVLEHVVVPPADDAAGRHGGVSLFRPRNLDHLIASNYLDLRFNRKIHWTVLLAVINLIGSHPRALWRVLSALLATADSTTRSQLLARITGPDSVMAAFRQQFIVLAPARALVLTLEPETRSGPAAADAGGADAHEMYRVRLEQAGRDASISEVVSHVDPTRITQMVAALASLLRDEAPMSPAEAREVDGLGRMLGEDILQDLGRVLAGEARASDEPIHLQLHIPRDLMKHPWELLHHQGGWLAEDFAIGRQVFSRSGTHVTSARMPGPLRALVIGNPIAAAPSLSFAAREAERIAEGFVTLAAQTDGLIDFVPERDVMVGEALTGAHARRLLREGRYDIVHFAGHAHFDPLRPDASAWLLSDGGLTAREIRNTLAWSEIRPWLVFANACEAAMDDATQGQGFGLASAFLDHGVSVFIGPLWPIPDDVGAEIATTFYEQLLKERQTVGEALRRARLLVKRRYFDPLHGGADVAATRSRAAVVAWASLVLYGNATDTFGQRFGAPAPPPAERADGADEADDT